MSEKSQKRLSEISINNSQIMYLGRFVKNSWDGDSFGHDSSGLVERVDFAEELLKIVLPAEFVLEESVLDRVC